MHNYDDIINLNRPVSKTRKPMSIYNRSAQFAPFSALKGYQEKLNEIARPTTPKIWLDEEIKKILNRKLQIINNNLQHHPKITITYFVKDQKKSGGTYKTITNTISKIDQLDKLIILNNKSKIKINDIVNINGDIFNKL